MPLLMDENEEGRKGGKWGRRGMDDDGLAEEVGERRGEEADD